MHIIRVFLLNEYNIPNAKGKIGIKYLGWIKSDILIVDQAKTIKPTIFNWFLSIKVWALLVTNKYNDAKIHMKIKTPKIQYPKPKV